jgi:hypothetical protein
LGTNEGSELSMPLLGAQELADLISGSWQMFMKEKKSLG